METKSTRRRGPASPAALPPALPPYSCIAPNCQSTDFLFGAEITHVYPGTPPQAVNGGVAVVCFRCGQPQCMTDREHYMPALPIAAQARREQANDGVSASAAGPRPRFGRSMPGG